MRRKEQSMDLAIDLASMVLPTPGTSSIRRWPSAIRHTRASRTSCSLPWITCRMLSAMVENEDAKRSQSLGSLRATTTPPGSIRSAILSPNTRTNPPRFHRGPFPGTSQARLNFRRVKKGEDGTTPPSSSLKSPRAAPLVGLDSPRYGGAQSGGLHHTDGVQPSSRANYTHVIRGKSSIAGNVAGPPDVLSRE